ncbi:MAG TPA: tRNA preQ1(34) S-adenosylmethionine ribosyltransferase-isomerase QueA [Allocoleopsis sp.]
MSQLVNPDQLLSSYDYLLPDDLIAQNPVFPRDSSRLLVININNIGVSNHYQHAIFKDLPTFLKPGDLLVMNNTRVMPARIYGYKTTGTPIEILLLEEKDVNFWLALVKPGKRLQPGAKIHFRSKSKKQNDLTATIISKDEKTGGRIIQFHLSEGVTLHQILDDFGEMPLPPYINNSQSESEDYQTVYAEKLGAIAAPTAGLHFTPELLAKLTETGINHTFITLHVGIGTFRPVEVENIIDHNMHQEWAEVSEDTVKKIQHTQAQGGRIIAVGTTVVRSLESAASTGKIQPFCGKTNLFIYPGYQFRVVDGLITNFHLPKSSLLMLVSALIGRERLLDLYKMAIAEKYRFYSFGDAMLIIDN